MSLKIGTRVRLVNVIHPISGNEYSTTSTNNVIGAVGVIKEIGGSDLPYRVVWDNPKYRTNGYAASNLEVVDRESVLEPTSIDN